MGSNRQEFKLGDRIKKVRGVAEFDSYANTPVLMMKDIEKEEKKLELTMLKKKSRATCSY